METSFIQKSWEKKFLTNKAELNLCNNFNWKYSYFCSGTYECRWIHTVKKSETRGKIEVAMLHQIQSLSSTDAGIWWYFTKKCVILSRQKDNELHEVQR